MDTERDRPAGDAAEAATAKKKPRAKKPAGVAQPKKVAAKKKPSAPKAPRVRKAKAAAGEDKSAGVKQAEATAVEGGAAPTASAAAAPTAAAPEIEVELRQAFLQQIYNKLYQTHPGQDAASMGKYAVAIEVGHFQKAASRNDYIAMLNKELERMEQIARAQLGPNAVSANAGSAAMVGNQMRPAAQQNGHGDDNRFASRPSSQNGSQLQQPLSGAPARVPPTSSAPSFSAPMNGQGYAASQQQQQQQQQSGRPATSAAYEQQNAQYYSSAQTPQQQQLRQQQQQQNLQNAQQISYQEFAQQFQQFDKNALIGHLWTQKITLMQWQSHINQLEMRVASLQDALNASYQRQNYDPSALRGTQIPQQGQYPRGFNQQPREQASRPPTSQPLNAETLRAHDLTMAGLNGNSEVYWRRVGVMKAMYLPALLSARDALENHQAPPNTAQGYKAENMKQSVVSALSILCEAPQSAEPRSFEVLDSIERFMHNTVKPIVERIQTKVTAVRNSANGMDSRAGIPTNQQQRPPPSGGQGMPISYDPRMQDPRAASGRTPTNGGNSRSEIRSMTESSSARMLNGLESPFGEPRVTLPTFSPSERRMASAGGAVAAKEDSKKSGSSRYEESLGGFEDLPEIAFDDEAQKSGESPAGNSPAASDKAVGTDA